jgi:hypothetical protein
MPPLTITLPDEPNEWLEDEVDSDDPTAPNSERAAARAHLADVRRLTDVEASVDDTVETPASRRRRR